MKMKLRNILLVRSAPLGAAACDDKDNTPTFPEEPVYDMTGFAKGADVSWLTEMEKSGVQFYDSTGRKTECMTLLRDLGMNSIRLRVWVNPSDGWCGKK
uniref:arabinogalactan endo-beta-1,4-galactanase n=1 Tax=uncultured organism TaxID=155900 RepID=A0A060BZM5_9ZZZZ|nr:Glyco_hydro_53 [uncultured organism]